MIRLPSVADAVRIVKGRPVLLVGVGVAALAGYKLLAGQGEAEPADAAEGEPAADAAATAPGLLSGALGSIGAPISYPTNGDLLDSGAATAPPPVPTPAPTPAPPPAPTPAPTPAPKVSYLVATVKAGTYDRYDLNRLANGSACSRVIGSYTTGGYSAEVRDLGASVFCDGTGRKRSLLVVLTGTHTGKIINRNTAAVTTRTR